MKRVGNLFDKIVTKENLELALKRAVRGKSKQYGVKKFRLEQLDELLVTLKNEEFKTSKYKTFQISDGKVRDIHSLPFYPDRVLHHAILNILEPIFIKIFTADTYSCIKGRGVHKASFKLREYLKSDVKYCLKLDIKKFYPSVDNNILKVLLRKKFKDKKLLKLLDNIIDSNHGLPLGSYTSQFLANFYLSYFDHWVKERLRIKMYLRYCDDIIILSDDKEELWGYFHSIREYLEDNLKLTIKDNYQVFPIDVRGIDWCGYKHYSTHVLIRKSIKKKYIKNNIKKNHHGWLKHCNSINLRNKYENN